MHNLDLGDFDLLIDHIYAMIIILLAIDIDFLERQYNALKQPARRRSE